MSGRFCAAAGAAAANAESAQSPQRAERKLNGETLVMDARDIVICNGPCSAQGLVTLELGP
jgi:hypothetical protein